MNLRSIAASAAGVLLLSACASTLQGSQSRAGALVPGAARSGRPMNASGCYGTFGVEAVPCPVRLRKSDGGSVGVSITGPQVVFAAIIGSDCAGPGSVCNVQGSTSNPTQFRVWSAKGSNVCGTAWVVFVGISASGTEIGTATVKVINKFC